jgi:hypothetical protein
MNLLSHTIMPYNNSNFHCSLTVLNHTMKNPFLSIGLTVKMYSQTIETMTLFTILYAN